MTNNLGVNKYVIGIAFIVCIILVLLAGTLSFSRIEPGYVGVEVHLYGGSKGLDYEPVPVGIVWYNRILTSIYTYPTFVQTAIWTRNPREGSPSDESITFNTIDGLVVSADISISFELAPDKVPEFFARFRDNLSNFAHTFLRSVARDAFNEVGSQYTVESIYGAKKEAFLKEVRGRIAKKLSPFGVMIEQFGFIGAPRLPQNVVRALNAKIQAIQDAMRVKNELATTTGEAFKKVAKAKGDAESNRILSASINDKLLEWRRLDLEAAKIKKWDGALPKVQTGNQQSLLLGINPILKNSD